MKLMMALKGAMDKTEKAGVKPTQSSSITKRLIKISQPQASRFK